VTTSLPVTALLLALLSLSALLVVLALAIVVRRGLRTRAAQRAEARSEPVRPLLLAILGGDGDDRAAALPALATLDRRTWTVVEPAVVDLLGKVRGEGREALVALLVARGVHERALRGARARSAVRRGRAAELLGALGTSEAVEALVALLDDPDEEVRLVAARALGRAEDPAAAEALVRSLGGSRAVPQRVVARSLARLGSGAEPALVAALGSADVLTRAVAADILGLVGAVGSVPVLAAAVRDPEGGEVRIRAARALGRLGLSGGAPPLLEAVAEDNPPALRAVAARALGDVGDATATVVLTSLLGDADHQVAQNAATALSRCGATGVQALAAVAGVDDGRVRAGTAPAATDAPGPPVPADVAPSAVTYARAALGELALTGELPDARGVSA
jgi:HEAT repeat protein